jgi:hypothetical protein
VWYDGLQRITGAATVRDAEQGLGIYLMTLCPAPPRTFDDSAGIDQHTVEVEQQGLAAELH